MIRKSSKEQMIQLQTSRGFVMASTQQVGAQNRTYTSMYIQQNLPRMGHLCSFWQAGGAWGVDEQEAVVHVGLGNVFRF